jgi:hypothetical protein
MYNSAYSHSGWFPSDSLYSRANTLKNQDKLPVGLALYTYNFIDTNAIQNNLVQLGTDSLLYDVVNRPVSPYQTVTTFIGSPLLDSIRANQGNNVVFSFSNNLLFIKSLLTITSLQVDFDNGNGLTAVSLGNDVIVHYSPSSTGYKFIKFVVGLSNNTTITSYAAVKVISFQNYTTFGTSGCNVANTILDIASDESFQGYDENTASKGYGRAEIFYATNTCDGVLRKPIIVVDGFDPLDSRSTRNIYDLVNQKITNQNTAPGFADDMGSKGYDIIVLDFPGRGADYIERNARVLMKLIEQVNTLKVGNEKIVLIGPSMGGLISRYALAYMEQHNNPHQVRLYVSFDAPHLGANIPLGDQRFLSYFSDVNPKAKENLDKQINSVAAKQMLVNHYQAVSSTLAGAPGFRNTFVQTMNNIGWPVGDPGQPFRKIALINGSLGGNELHNACEKGFTMDTRKYHTVNLFLFKFNYTTFTFATSKMYFTPGYGNVCNVFEGKRVLKTNKDYSFYTAANTSGIDTAPGGTFDTQGVIADEGDNTLSHMLGNAFKTKFYSVIRDHSFINTKSALAFSGSNQNLSENLSGRSLVCSGETPFNSYFGSLSTNRAHIDLWPEAISWLTKEIDGYPQLPPVNYAAAYNINGIDGNERICETFGTYSIPAISGAQYTWSFNTSQVDISGSTSSNNLIIKAKPGEKGNLILYVTISHPGCGAETLSRSVMLGVPGYSAIHGPPTMCINQASSSFEADEVAGATHYNWAIYPIANTYITGNGSRFVNIQCFTPGSYSITCEITTPCGIVYGAEYAQSVGTPDGMGNCTEGGGASAFRIYPNPSNTQITVTNSEKDKTGINKSVSKPKPFDYKIYNKFGNVLRSGRSVNGEDASINVQNIPDGTYFIHISHDKELIRKQIIVQH